MAQRFFSNDKFRLVDMKKEGASKSGGEKEAFANRLEQLVYCETCEMLRPPRSFHCSTCNVCIEVHDHHCPWVGTCVAYRNHRYFTMFLFGTSLHGLHTCLLALTSMIKIGVFFSDPKGLDQYHSLRLFLVCFSGMFSLTLGAFFTHQNYYIINNITSNELLRRRWNGSNTRRIAHELLSMRGRVASFCERMRYFYFSQLPYSKVEKYKRDGEGVDNVEILREYGIILESESENMV